MNVEHTIEYRTAAAPDLIFRWAGCNHTVNVYDLDGNEIDVFSVGDFALDAATDDEVRAAIISYVLEDD